jgi:hypothetical protein
MSSNLAMPDYADLDRPDTVTTMSGRELMETGVPVAMLEKPQAVVLRYKAQIRN